MIIDITEYINRIFVDQNSQDQSTLKDSMSQRVQPVVKPQKVQIPVNPQISRPEFNLDLMKQFMDYKAIVVIFCADTAKKLNSYGFESKSIVSVDESYFLQSLPPVSTATNGPNSTREITYYAFETSDICIYSLIKNIAKNTIYGVSAIGRPVSALNLFKMPNSDSNCVQFMLILTNETLPPNLLNEIVTYIESNEEEHKKITRAHFKGIIHNNPKVFSKIFKIFVANVIATKREPEYDNIIETLSQWASFANCSDLLRERSRLIEEKLGLSLSSDSIPLTISGIERLKARLEETIIERYKRGEKGKKREKGDKEVVVSDITPENTISFGVSNSPSFNIVKPISIFDNRTIMSSHVEVEATQKDKRKHETEEQEREEERDEQREEQREEEKEKELTKRQKI